MKKYTQEEFDNFEIVGGRRQCPSGDYSGIKSFGERSSFGKWSSFGEWCSFGERCSFREGSSFGERCSFGKGCSFREGSSFGERCSFGKGGLYCLFEFNKLVNLNGVFEHPIRIYFNTGTKEYYLSIGCKTFATLDEAVEYGENEKYDMGVVPIIESIIKEILG